MKVRFYTEKKMRFLKNQSVYVENPYGERCLWAAGIYPTKKKVEDLPESFVYGRFYKRWGYLDSAGVQDLKYRPNRFANHVLKDDFLFISYQKPIEKEEGTFLTDWYKADEYIYGGEIIDFIRGVDRYSDFDTTEIKKQIEAKVDWFNEHFCNSESEKNWERLVSYPDWEKPPYRPGRKEDN